MGASLLAGTSPAVDGNVLVVENGNHRVQKLTRDGKSLGVWGHEGRGVGELYNPWALVRDRQGRVHACVACDFVTEFGAYIAVPLRK